jgi:hypothetical protein
MPAVPLLPAALSRYAISRSTSLSILCPPASPLLCAATVCLCLSLPILPMCPPSCYNYLSSILYPGPRARSHLLALRVVEVQPGARAVVMACAHDSGPQACYLGPRTYFV